VGSEDTQDDVESSDDAERSSDSSSERDRSSLAVPIWLDRTAAWAMRLIVIAIALGGLLWLTLQLRAVLIPFLVALLVASALRPVAAALERHSVPRSLAAAIPLLVLGAIGAAAGWFVYRSTASTLESDEVTEAAVRERVEDWLMGSPFNLTTSQIDEGERSLRSWLSSGIGSFGPEQAALVVQVVGGALLAAVLSFFLLKDGAQIWTAITSRVNPARADSVHRSGQAISGTLAAYVRSIALTGIADGVLIGIGLWLLDVPLVLPLVILTAFAGLFPLVGAVVAGAAASLVALVAVGPSTAFWVVILTLAVQQFEGNVMQPLIVARQVSIHPVVVLLSLTAGGAIAGLAGAFLAVPVVASLIAAVKAFSAEMEVGGDPLEDGVDAPSG